jgi:hypothetical protein
MRNSVLMLEAGSARQELRWRVARANGVTSWCQCKALWLRQPGSLRRPLVLRPRLAAGLPFRSLDLDHVPDPRKGQAFDRCSILPSMYAAIDWKLCQRRIAEFVVPVRPRATVARTAHPTQIVISALTAQTLPLSRGMLEHTGNQIQKSDYNPASSWIERKQSHRLPIEEIQPCWRSEEHGRATAAVAGSTCSRGNSGAMTQLAQVFPSS